MAKKAAPKAAESKPEPKPAETSATIAAKKADSAAKKGEPAKKADASAKKSEPKAAVRPKPATKTELFTTLSEKTDIPKKGIGTRCDARREGIEGDLGKKGAGVFVIPGLVKFKVVNKPATKERQTINPFTKEPMTTAARPARNIVKAVLLKSLKDLAV